MHRRFRDWAVLGTAERRRLGSVAVQRARALQLGLNAYAVVTGEASIVQPGILDGMPYAAKDIFAAPDRRPYGGLGKPQHIPDEHADVLRALDEAGGFRVGFTQLTEIAFEPSGYNAEHGRVCNPWNTDFISGGSSSGSAAAVASGSAVIALGSDTAGSLRIPAHACGLTAWKPTYGAVSMRGVLPLAPTLDTVGLLARSAVDAALAVKVLAPGLSPEAPIRRVVFLRDLLDAAHPSIRSACQDGIDTIAAPGVVFDVREARSFLDSCDTPVFTITQAEAARHHRALLAGDTIGPVLRKRLAKGLEIDEQTLAAAAAQRFMLARAFDTILGDADVAILPVMAIRTPRAVECDPADAAFTPRTLYELSRLTRFVNMIGFPAVALPVGFDDRGMPVAMQLVGRPNSDLTLLALAAAMQSKSDWHGRVPDAVASELMRIDAPDISPSGARE